MVGYSFFRFGSSCEKKLIKWIIDNIAKTSCIVDIGCGNGSFLKKLHDLGFKNLTGYDYSQNAIEFAALKIPDICFKKIDLLEIGEAENFDFIFDKGTFDAISLSQNFNNTDCMSKILSKYKKAVGTMLKPKTKFMITSCNWTQNELLTFFSPEFKLQSTLEHAVFKYGNSTGQDVSTCIFIRD